MTHAFEPFADDTSAPTIGGLTVENGADRISLSGSLDIAKDRRGLTQARALHELMGQVVAALEAEKDLPARVAPEEPAAVTKRRNPWA